MTFKTLQKLFLTTSLLAAGTGCSGQSTPPAADATLTSQIINTVCPIMGGEATAEVSVDWNGKKVGFCCPPCIEEWNELSEDEKIAKIKSAAAKTHGEHAHESATAPAY